MKKFDANQEKRRRERLIDLYVEGLDTGAAEKIAIVLEAAVADNELDRIVHEINRAYEEEHRLTSFVEQAATVRELAREHLPSAFADEELPPRPLTIGDVAKQLEIGQNLPQSERDAARALLENQTPLPKTMSFGEIKRLASELKFAASNLFWRRFLGAAMSLRAARSEEMALFAARQKRLKKIEKNDERRNETKNQ